MGVTEITNNSYIVCAYDSLESFGRMVAVYPSLEKAKEHIRFQQEIMGSKCHWNILHILNMEWINSI